MSEQQVDKSDVEEVKRPSSGPKLLLGGFVGLVVVAETLIFFLMIPSADDVAALAEARLIDKVEASMQDAGEETLDDENAKAEFALGDFSVTFIPPGSDGNYRVDFPLYVTIYEKDVDKMEALFSKKKARFQHHIMLEVRNATVDELMESQLGLIQRRILAKSIEVLEEGEGDKPVPELLGINFPEPGFQVYEE